MIKVWFLFLSVSCGTSLGIINNVRLHEFSGYGSNVGIVEIQYNGTWGTNCGIWDLASANVTCRMLGYSHALCATANLPAGYDRSDAALPVACGIYCAGDEESLNDCYLEYNGNEICFLCQIFLWHYSSVVCGNDTSSPDLILPNIGEIQLTNSTTRSITISWDGVHPPQRTDYSYRYRVLSTSSSSSLRITTVPVTNITEGGKVIATIQNLVRDTQYAVNVRLEASPLFCSPSGRTDVYGNYSENVIFSTSNTVSRLPKVQVRLITPIVGVNFMGRVEININGTWGSVSASYSDFRRSAGDVVCNQLNYSKSCSNVYNGAMGSGRGRIWLYRLSCSDTSEILDDCSFSYCNSRQRSCNHRNDVGVVCVPEPEEFLPAPNNFKIVKQSGSTVRITWTRFTFPRHVQSNNIRKLVLEYTRSDTNRTSEIRLHRNSAFYSITVAYGTTITATIRAEGRLSGNYGCSNIFQGARSREVSLEIVEEPPSMPPRRFHISVVNCTTIRAQWTPPSYSSLKGVLRGYKLFYQPFGADNDTEINLLSNITEYLINNLIPSTRYEVSVLAYTVGDGPRSIHLYSTTNSRDICHTNIIDVFGINGDGIDIITLQPTSSSSSTILCGSTLPNVSINWYFFNGSSIGNSNRDLREGKFVNGTRVLQFGAFGSIYVCDSGVYICRANQTSSGRVEQRSLKVTIGRTPPGPATPQIINTTSTSITFNWTELDCDGGYNVVSYSASIRPHSDYYFPLFIFDYYFFFPSYRYINGLNSQSTVATFHNLQPSTNYDLRIRAVGQDNNYGRYSAAVTATTLPQEPLPPYNVSVVLVEHNVIQVSWRIQNYRVRSAQGSLVYITVYAIPFNNGPSSSSMLDVPGNMLQTFSKNFSAGVTSGNLTLNRQLGVEYHVRVTTTFYYSSSDKNQESPYSTLSPQSTIFVPFQGLPTLSDFSVVATTNTSISVSWNIPRTTDTISGFYIEYAAMVEGRTALGNLIRYMHKGNLTVSAASRRALLQPLIPQSSYLLKAAILTTRGEGAQVEATGMTTTAMSDLEKVSYFHVRFGPVLSCSSFRKDIEGQEGVIRLQILEHLNEQCECALTSLNIESGLFSCGEKNHEIIYRAQILGTSNYSATGLINLLQAWIGSGQAYVKIDSFRMRLDPSCPAVLDTIDDPDCATVTVATTEDQSNRPTSKVNVAEQNSGDRSLVLGVAIVGVIIVVLLLVLIATVVVYFFRKSKRSPKLFGSGQLKSSDTYNGKDIDTAPFVNMEERKESSMFEEKLS